MHFSTPRARIGAASLLAVLLLLTLYSFNTLSAKAELPPEIIEPPPAEEERPPGPRFKPPRNTTVIPINDNFPLAASAKSAADLPPIPSWNKPDKSNIRDPTPLFIGFTRNWPVLQQAVVGYITAGWPPEDIYVVDNTGTMNSNAKGGLTLQNPSYLDHHRLTKILGVNVLTTPTLFTFAQLQNFFLYQAIEHDWPHYWWSHMDVLILPDEHQTPYKSLYHRAVDALHETQDPSFGPWGIRFFAYDRLALVNTEAFSTVGGWDTLIPFYGTDCDMHERLMMANYSLTHVFIGYIYDVGTTFEDLSLLYRPKDAICDDVVLDTEIYANGDRETYGLGDCRYGTLTREGDRMQIVKNEGDRNFWQATQAGGRGEPFYRDPEGFEVGLRMHMEHGVTVMHEKWGHRGCDIRGSGLGADDAWQVLHDWE